MKSIITDYIIQFVSVFSASEEVSTSWGTPLVGFASAGDALFTELKTAVSPSHSVPTDLLPDAHTVIAFFLPFPKSASTANAKGRMSSSKWARSYIETNELIKQMSAGLSELLQEHGAKAATVPATHNWIEDTLISNWSHRHVAFIAGLGRFGLNNMLITSQGCCGRIGSMVTTAEITPDPRSEKEACLYKFDGSCKKCVNKCVVEALSEDCFDRFKCYRQLLENAEKHKDLGHADVCGKCLAAVPCAHTNPVKMKTDARKGRKHC